MVNVKIVISSLLISIVVAFNNEQLAIFDLVEEIDGSFYDFLKVPRDANLRTIKKAFRQLSLVLHPDKLRSNSDNADIQFRNLVAIYDVLKDDDQRKFYDNVLDNGLPDWRSATFYYRRVRKLTAIEIGVLLTVCLTIGQYLFAWACYLEELLNQTTRKVKKEKRRLTVEEYLAIEKPRLWNTFPIQIPIFLWHLLIRLPEFIRNLFVKLFIEKKIKQNRSENDSDYYVNESKVTKKRKLVNMVPVEIVQKPVSYLTDNETISETPTTKTVVGSFWTDDDLNELIRLINKYSSSGTLNKWTKIAEQMNRNINEIVYMANKIKENDYRPTIETDSLVEPKKEKIKTRNTLISDEKSSINTEWNQIQQKALEKALVAFPKSFSDRWEKIANSVPGKSKEECIYRYKYLAEKIRNQKS